jgi:hypothetical protein
MKHQFNKIRVYLNLPETLGALRTTLIYTLSLKVKAAARQGPAVTVIPVFIPKNPSLLSNLFVFYHSTYLTVFRYFAKVLYFLQLTTVLKS